MEFLTIHNLQIALSQVNNPQDRYRRYFLKGRPIDVPDIELKKIQKYILQYIEARIHYDTFWKVATCVKQAGIIKNAKAHICSDWYLNLDLKKFFHTVKYEQLDGIVDATTLSMIWPYVSLHNSLPMGAPTSPILANLAAYKLDNLLLGEFPSFHITRYMDDISISGKGQFDHKITGLACNIIEHYGFKVNHKKTKLYFRGRNAKITGITITDNGHTKINRTYHKRIRSELHRLATSKLPIDQSTLAKLQFINSIDPQRSLQLLTYYRNQLSE